MLGEDRAAVHKKKKDRTTRVALSRKNEEAAHAESAARPAAEGVEGRVLSGPRNRTTKRLPSPRERRIPPFHPAWDRKKQAFLG